MSAEPAAGHQAKHPYHLVDPSPWPIVGAIAAGLTFWRRRGGGDDDDDEDDDI